MIEEEARDSPHACAVGYSLRDVFLEDDYFENMEVALGKESKKIKDGWTTDSGSERGRRNDDVPWLENNNNNDEISQFERHQKKQEWTLSNLKKMRWKVFDTLRNRTDGIIIIIIMNSHSLR